MRSFWLVVFVVLLGLVTMAPTALALESPVVLRFVDVEEEFTPIDGADFFEEEDAPPPVGTRFLFRDGLYQWAGSKRGRRVGHIDGFCTFIRVSLEQRSATSYCTGQAWVPGGSMLLAVFITFAEEEEGGVEQIPVIGGTGRFSNARGVMELRSLPSGNSAVTFRVGP